MVRSNLPRALAAVVLLTAGVVSTPTHAAGGWRFTEVAADAGLNYAHGFAGGTPDEPRMMAGGVAAGDFDGDLLVDLYVVRGDQEPNLLLRNRGDGSFEDVATSSGVAIRGEQGNGPLFADLDGDGWLDLLIGGVGGTKPRLFQNRAGAFVEVTAPSGLTAPRDTFSAAAGDYDRDGDLDLFLARWNPFGGSGGNHLWRNDGGLRFTPVDDAAGLAPLFATVDWTFTPRFTDLDDDGWPDLLIAADFGTSKVLINRGDGSFEDRTTPVISDENGMGSALGDFDNDGDLDWFVSSIWDPDGMAQGAWGVTGNRLYRNQGGGVLVDATENAGVREGFWGWGSCFADFDNDGLLDLFHVNGIQVRNAPEFHQDPARLFLNQGDGSFAERSADVGIEALDQGRGVVCFDYDRDGDVDLLIANNSGPPQLWRNDLPPGTGFLTVRLEGPGGNLGGIGARIHLRSTVDGRLLDQVREIQAGSNYLSQDPAEAQFGLGSEPIGSREIDELRVLWPDGTETVRRGIEPDQLLIVRHPDRAEGGAEIPAASPFGLALLALLLTAGGLALLTRRG